MPPTPNPPPLKPFLVLELGLPPTPQETVRIACTTDPTLPDTALEPTDRAFIVYTVAHALAAPRQPETAASLQAAMRLLRLSLDHLKDEYARRYNTN